MRAKPASRHLLSKAEVQYYVRMLLQMKPMAFMLLLVLVTGFCWPAASDVPAQPTVEAETEIYAFKPANSALVLGTTNVYDSGESGFTVAPGQLFATFDSEGWQKHSYDVRGRELKTSRYLNTTALTYTIQASFDDADHVRTLAYPASLLTVTNGYDTGGHLSDVWRSDGGTNTHYLHYRGFTELNQPLGADFGNSVTTTNDYWPVSRRLHSLTTFIGGTNLQSLSYEYNRADDVSAINDAAYTGTSSASLSATYDDLHRLASVTRSSNTVSFSYSAIGNVLANGEWPGAGYDYGSRLPHAVKKVGSQYYAYDMNGNTVARGVQNLRYDAANHLVLVRSNGVALATFGYADDGSRLWKQTGTNLQIWVGSLYEEKQGKRLCHIWAGGRRVATFDSAGTLASGTNTTSLYFCHQDHLGSSSVLSDHAGNRVEHYEYSAFGRERYNDPAASFPVSQRFTGQVLDAETGLYYYGSRYYDPELARFIQPDTLIPDVSNPQSWNRYAYTLNNPLKYVDPTGHWDLPAVTYNWMPNSWVRYLGGSGAAPPQSTDPLSNLGMLESDLGGYDATPLHTAARTLRAVGEGVTLAGVYNSAYTAATGKDAVDFHEVSGGERVQAGGATAASMFPIVSRGGTAAKELGALVTMSDALWANASQRTVAGYTLWATAGKVGETYSVNVAGLYAIKGEAQGLPALAGALKSEAKAAGASKISITANAIINGSLVKPQIFERAAKMNGFTYRQINKETAVLTAPVGE